MSNLPPYGKFTSSPFKYFKELDGKPCKCGTIPKENDIFIYYSPYGSIVEGVVREVAGSSIYSTNNVKYPNHDIQIITRQKERAEKLNRLINDTK